MRTIGRKWPVGIGPDRQATCSYCGVQWLRSQLRRDASGNLACPDDAPGLDVVSLSEGNARLMRSQAPRYAGPDDGAYDDFACPPDPGFIDPNGPPAERVNGGPTGPLSVDTLLWLRSDNVSHTIPGRVAVWPDMSGYGRNCVAVTESVQPSWAAADAALGGLPAVVATGSHWLRAEPFGGGAPLWVWQILKPLDSDFGIGMGVGAELFVNWIAGTASLLTGLGIGATVAMAAGEWSRMMFEFNVAGTDRMQVRGSAAIAASGGQITPTELSLFSTSNGSLKSKLALAEVLLTRGRPSDSEIADIEAYGVARYGGGPFA